MTDHTEMQIPDDVMEAAIAVNGDIMFKGYDDTVRVIAMALVRERERCARIAEAEWVWPNKAAAIRGSVDK